MAVTITNRKNTSSVIHVAVANTTIICSGNSTTTNVDATNTCLAIGDEVLTGVRINQAFWGVDPAAGEGFAILKRGANTVAIYDSTGYHDYAAAGMPITVDQSANLTVEFSGTANAYLMLEVQKIGTFTSDYINT